MDRRTPTVSELVRRAVDICDPDRHDAALARFERQLEDDNEPVTAVDRIEERLALAAEGGGLRRRRPAVAVASAVVLYLAGHARRDRVSDDDPHELIRLAVRAQWHRDPPHYVADWVAARI